MGDVLALKLVCWLEAKSDEWAVGGVDGEEPNAGMDARFFRGPVKLRELVKVRITPSRVGPLLFNPELLCREPDRLSPGFGKVGCDEGARGSSIEGKAGFQ